MVVAGRPWTPRCLAFSHWRTAPSSSCVTYHHLSTALSTFNMLPCFRIILACKHNDRICVTTAPLSALAYVLTVGCAIRYSMCGSSGVKCPISSSTTTTAWVRFCLFCPSVPTTPYTACLSVRVKISVVLASLTVSLMQVRRSLFTRGF